MNGVQELKRSRDQGLKRSRDQGIKSSRVQERDRVTESETVRQGKAPHGCFSQVDLPKHQKLNTNVADDACGEETNVPSLDLLPSG